MRYPICAFVKVRDRISIVLVFHVLLFSIPVFCSLCVRFLCMGMNGVKGMVAEGCVKGENRTSGGAFLNENRKAWL